jgi:hypothetical protein
MAFGLVKAFLISDHQLVFTRSIRKPCNLLTIRRPNWRAVSDSGSIGQVAGITFLLWNGDDFSSEFKNSPLAGGR